MLSPRYDKNDLIEALKVVAGNYFGSDDTEDLPKVIKGIESCTGFEEGVVSFSFEQLDEPVLLPLQEDLDATEEAFEAKLEDLFWVG